MRSRDAEQGDAGRLLADGLARHGAGGDEGRRRLADLGRQVRGFPAQVAPGARLVVEARRDFTGWSVSQLAHAVWAASASPPTPPMRAHPTVTLDGTRTTLRLEFGPDDRPVPADAPIAAARPRGRGGRRTRGWRAEREASDLPGWAARLLPGALREEALQTELDRLYERADTPAGLVAAAARRSCEIVLLAWRIRVGTPPAFAPTRRERVAAALGVTSAVGTVVGLLVDVPQLRLGVPGAESVPGALAIVGLSACGWVAAHRLRRRLP